MSSCLLNYDNLYIIHDSTYESDCLGESGVCIVCEKDSWEDCWVKVKISAKLPWNGIELSLAGGGWSSQGGEVKWFVAFPDRMIFIWERSIS